MLTALASMAQVDPLRSAEVQRRSRYKRLKRRGEKKRDALQQRVAMAADNLTEEKQVDQSRES